MYPVLISGGQSKLLFKPDLTLEEVQAENPKVSRGRYHPEECKALQRVAILIPHRNREKHLIYLLEHLHPFLQRQQLDYGIYIIHQVSVGLSRALYPRDAATCLFVLGERILIKKRLFFSDLPLRRAEVILVLNAEPWDQALGSVTVLIRLLGKPVFVSPPTLASPSPRAPLSSPASPIPSGGYCVLHNVGLGFCLLLLNVAVEERFHERFQRAPSGAAIEFCGFPITLALNSTTTYHFKQKRFKISLS